MAAGTVAVVGDEDSVDVSAVDGAVGGGNRKHAADDDAGDAAVELLVGGLPAVCDVGVDAAGDSAVG